MCSAPEVGAQDDAAPALPPWLVPMHVWGIKVYGHSIALSCLLLLQGVWRLGKIQVEQCCWVATCCCGHKGSFEQSSSSLLEMQ